MSEQEHEEVNDLDTQSEIMRSDEALNEKMDQDVLQLLADQKVAVFIVAYNAEKHIESVIERVPYWVRCRLAEIYVIDDSSSDDTFGVAKRLAAREDLSLNIYRTPYNQGYGGNQILGYQHAIERGHDIVVLLHGDGQYAPEELPNILKPYVDSSVGAVFGSRFLSKGKALEGGMPKYKFFGNRVLTWWQNLLLGAKLSEMHSGYRSYRMSGMKKVPFAFNSKGFDFDADIIIQWIEAGERIVEVPIPTFYGDEICHVNGIQYAYRCIRACAINLLMKVELFYDPKFDLSHLKPSIQRRGKSPYGMEAYVKNLAAQEDGEVLFIHRGSGDDRHLSEGLKSVASIIEMEIDSRGEVMRCGGSPTQVQGGEYKAVLAPDLIEHLGEPEITMSSIFQLTQRHGVVLFGVSNVAFFPIRLMLLIGSFNYGRRGILDMSHHRLFTRKSIRRLAQYHGFELEEIMSFGVPLSDLLPHMFGVKILEQMGHFLAKICPSLFAYQIMLKCRRTLSPLELMDNTFTENEASK